MNFSSPVEATLDVIGGKWKPVILYHLTPEVPPKVEYSVTEYGNTLRPITKVMCGWGQRHMRRIRINKK